MGRLIEGLWDCSYCNTKGVRGGLDECPHCGHPRDESVKFYLEGTPNYVDEDTAKTINKSPDWLCRYCNGFNSDESKACEYCGASKEESELNYFENLSKQNEKKDQLKEQEETIKNKYINSGIKENKVIEMIKGHSKTVVYSLLGLVLVVLIVSSLVALFTPKELVLTVDEFSWSRTINIEEERTTQEDGWSLPSNARLLYSKEEISGYDSVIDYYETKTRDIQVEEIVGYTEITTGTRDLGNGYFEEITDKIPVYEYHTETETYEDPVYRQVAVYDTKYYYEIDRWEQSRTIESDAADKKPYWKEYSLSNKERIAYKKESYALKTTDEDKKIGWYTIGVDDWNSLDIGDTFNARVYFGNYIEIIE